VRRRHRRGDRQDQRQAENPAEELSAAGYHGVKLHKVAGKCGVFAETDINGLQKVGTPPDELMASLFDAIVLQNLSVLTRGSHAASARAAARRTQFFIRGMREAWQANIPRMWQERKVEVPEGAKPEELIKVPQNAQYFAALGAIEFGKGEEDCVGCYHGFDKLVHYIDFGRQEEKAKAGGKGLVKSDDELAISASSTAARSSSRHLPEGQTVSGFIGIDGGSTSTKAVLLDEKGDILCKSYQLSNGNPIQDTIEMFENLRGQVEAQGAKLEVLGVATTGYAKDILKDVLKADVALVETVAHTESALKFYEDPHVIVDVGGQDIKLIILKDGRVKDFKLNTQCSAGNGYFLQSTAEGFGMKVEDFADLAFSASPCRCSATAARCSCSPTSSTSSARAGSAQEILAGLAAVLPKNVFLYVASIPNLAALGRASCCRAARRTISPWSRPKWISSAAASARPASSRRSSSTSIAANPARSARRRKRCACGATAMRTTFIGLDAVRKIEYRTTRNEDTRCNFCKNTCLRTFIDIKTDMLPCPLSPPVTRRRRRKSPRCRCRPTSSG
jgi:activator of 2-hydroxyglutaryl-CoA dehydratase